MEPNEGYNRLLRDFAFYLIGITTGNTSLPFNEEGQMLEGYIQLMYFPEQDHEVDWEEPGIKALNEQYRIKEMSTFRRQQVAAILQMVKAVSQISKWAALQPNGGDNSYGWHLRDENRRLRAENLKLQEERLADKATIAKYQDNVKVSPDFAFLLAEIITKGIPE